MKNLSVGKKIMAGFMAVIVMMAAILALNVVTSSWRNKGLTRITLLNELAWEASSMEESFMLARLEARAMQEDITSASEYAQANNYLYAAESHLDTMVHIVEDLDAYGEETIVLRQIFRDVRRSLDESKNSTTKATNALVQMDEAGSNMHAAAADLFGASMAQAQLLAMSEPAAAVSYSENVLAASKNMSDTIYDIQVVSRSLIFEQDASVLPQIEQYITSLKEQCDSIMPFLRTDSGRQAVRQVSQATGQFALSVDEVSAALAISEAAHSNMMEKSSSLGKLVTTMVADITLANRTMSEETIRTSSIVLFITLVVSAVALVFSVFIATYLGRLITRPLNKMKNVMQQVSSTGNLSFAESTTADILKAAKNEDEIGQSLHAFCTFIEHILTVAAALDNVAKKDLSMEIKLLSEKDTMGLSLQTVVQNLNAMFTEINQISTQVAIAAHEIATGSQSLAQGSAEQADTVKEINASINEIHKQMSESTATARGSARQANEITLMAQDGSDKMSHMTGSMQNINDASKGIGNVIKVIDEIAYQTNILALNAAVEAARAGEHGKGFAAVADEVRALAAKSATAAKETARLISVNIQKAEQGIVDTAQTAESFAKIIQGIAETNESLKIITRQAEETRNTTEQVAASVDMVTHVAEQNSVTSEESAAASDEMSKQALHLQQLIAQFRLKTVTSSPKSSLAVAEGAAAYSVDSFAEGYDWNVQHTAF